MLLALAARREGLSSSEAGARLAEYGGNSFPRSEPPGLLRVFLRQFQSPLIYVLLLAAVVSAAMGDWTDAGFILMVLLLNASIGAIQEQRAERSAEALRGLVVARAHVLRDGEEQEINAEEVVPGDIVIVESGVKVPADLRLISGGLELDESLLTGESVPVSKHPDAQVAQEAGLADRANMAFAGTLVTKGRAYGVVVETGLGTELGKIAASLTGTELVKPPLLQRMERFTRKITYIVSGAVLVLGGVSILRGASLHEVFLGSVALAVAVIPEGLPVAMTVALAIAVRRMSARKVIARRLAAVEALGSCTYIASDKTGTLTLNELTVQRVLLPGQSAWRAEGQGSVPEGSVLIPAEVDAAPAQRQLERLGTAVALCNDAGLAQRGGSWVSHGDAVDVALLVLAEKLHLSRAALEAAHPRQAAVPFEAERQYAASVNQFPDGQRLLVKGAGERVLAMCTRSQGATAELPLDREALEASANALAASGYRVLAVAEGHGKTLADGSVDPSCLSELVLLGFIGMIDPLRPEARRAVHACHAAGIEVAMVTGDHPVTALAIASQLGLADEGAPVVTGPALKSAASQGQQQFDALVSRSHVFARVEPQQKLDIVQGLIRQGHFVAVTGDGANDAPAMRAAHIGVAMGQRGTDVARETSELILTDDNFASIVAGVEEGRIAYGNVRKVIFLLISSGAAELILFTASIASGLPLPLFPAQLLWLNLVTNGIQDVALAFEPGEGGELDRPPRPPQEPIFNRLMVERTLVSAAVMGGVAFTVFKWLLDNGWELDDARNALLLLMVLFENVQAGNSRSERRSLLALSPLKNPLLFIGTAAAQVLHILAMYTPGLRDVLHVQPVSFELWLTLLGLALSLFLVMEADKLLRHWRERPRANARSAAA